MKSNLKNITRYILLLLLAVQTLNLSINSIEFYNTPCKVVTDIDDLDYVDSMIEFLLENVMGMSKQTFHDHIFNSSIAKFQQNLIHFDLRSIPFPLLLAYAAASKLAKTRMFPANDNAVCLCCKEVLPQPPQSVLA